MYRIIIADDEKDERNVIRFLLHKFNFELHIDEVTNGKEALSKLQETPADILFTDVKMPFMNGIELAEKARKLYPNIQIIFFSGYDDFDYAKKAISLRAFDYILKPVNPVEFQKTLSSVLKSVKNLAKEQEQEEARLTYLKSHILYRLINKTPLDTLKNEYPSEDFSFLNIYSCLILIQFDESFFDKLPQNEDIISFQEQLQKVSPEYFWDFINLNPFQSILLFQEKETYMPCYKELAEKIQKHIFTVYNKNCYIAVSKKIYNADEIPTIYDETEQYLEDRFFYSDIYIYPLDNSSVEKNEYTGRDEDYLQAIQTYIQYKDTYSLKKNINILFEKYNKKQNLSPVYIRFLFSKLFQIICKELPEYTEHSINKQVETLYECQYLSDIQDIINDVKDKLISNLEIEQESPNHSIQIIKQYINEHYHEDLSLNLLAKKVFLTPRYLSEIFIQETGCGINKYTKNLRMKNAKNLLINTNMKITDICKAVGYSNESYFCRSFRENFGLSPEKYRQIHI